MASDLSPLHDSLAKTIYPGLYKGRVEGRNDHIYKGRLKVRVVGVHSFDTSAIPTDDLPWAWPCSAFACDGGGIFAIPTPNEFVWVMFEGGNPDFPVWMGGWWGASSGKASANSGNPAAAAAKTQAPMAALTGTPVPSVTATAQQNSALLGKAASAMSSYTSLGNTLNSNIGGIGMAYPGAVGAFSGQLNTLIAMGNNPSQIALNGPALLSNMAASINNVVTMGSQLSTFATSGLSALGTSNSSIILSVNNQLGTLGTATPLGLTTASNTFVTGLGTNLTTLNTSGGALSAAIATHNSALTGLFSTLTGAMQSIFAGGVDGASVIAAANSLFSTTASGLSAISGLVGAFQTNLGAAIGNISTNGGTLVNLATSLFGALIPPSQLVPLRFVNAFGGTAPWDNGILKMAPGDASHTYAPDSYAFISPRGKHIWHSDNFGRELLRLGDQMGNFLHLNTQTGTMTHESSAGLTQQAAKPRGLTFNRPDEVTQLYTAEQWQLTIDDKQKFAELNSLSKFKLRLDDNAKRAELWTANKNYLILDDNEQRIVIMSAAGRQIVIDDQYAGITIVGKTGYFLLDDANGILECRANTQVNLKSPGEINIAADGAVNISGATINLNGPVHDTSSMLNNPLSNSTYSQPDNPTKAIRANDVQPAGAGGASTTANGSGAPVSGITTPPGPTKPGMGPYGPAVPTTGGPPATTPDGLVPVQSVNNVRSANDTDGITDPGLPGDDHRETTSYQPGVFDSTTMPGVAVPSSQLVSGGGTLYLGQPVYIQSSTGQGIMGQVYDGGATGFGEASYYTNSQLGNLVEGKDATNGQTYSLTFYGKPANNVADNGGG